MTSLAPHQHQMFGHDRAGITRWACRVQAPAAYEPQVCELGGRLTRPSFSRIQIDADLHLRRRPVRLNSSRRIGQHSRARAIVGCASPFHSMHSTGSNQSRARQHEAPVNVSSPAGLVHDLFVLSKTGSSAGFKTSWKDLTFGTEPLSPDDKIHD